MVRLTIYQTHRSSPNVQKPPNSDTEREHMWREQIYFQPGRLRRGHKNQTQNKRCRVSDPSLPSWARNISQADFKHEFSAHYCFLQLTVLKHSMFLSDPSAYSDLYCSQRSLQLHMQTTCSTKRFDYTYSCVALQ